MLPCTRGLLLEGETKNFAALQPQQYVMQQRLMHDSSTDYCGIVLHLVYTADICVGLVVVVLCTYYCVCCKGRVDKPKKKQIPSMLSSPTYRLKLSGAEHI